MSFEEMGPITLAQVHQLRAPLHAAPTPPHLLFPSRLFLMPVLVTCPGVIGLGSEGKGLQVTSLFSFQPLSPYSELSIFQTLEANPGSELGAPSDPLSLSLHR